MPSRKAYEVCANLVRIVNKCNSSGHGFKKVSHLHIHDPQTCKHSQRDGVRKVGKVHVVGINGSCNDRRVELLYDVMCVKVGEMKQPSPEAIGSERDRIVPQLFGVVLGYNPNLQQE